MATVLTGQVRNAIKDYKMIENGDVVAVGVSGGKDSLAMLTALAELKTYIPVKFELKAFTIALGFEGFDVTPINNLCKKLNIPYEVIDTKIGKIVFDVRKESNPCSLCANMRRGALNNEAKKAGCNKVALGHSKDDIIETYLMSMFYEGRLNTLSPVTYLSNTQLYAIRPLAYSYEKDVRYFVNKRGLQIVESPCPANGKTTRQEMRDFVREMSHKNPHFRSNIFGVIKRNHISGW